MNPLPLIAAAAGALGVWWLFRRAAELPPLPAAAMTRELPLVPPVAPPPVIPELPPVIPELPLAPAYPALVQASRAERQALADVAAELGISAAALATVIELESAWNPAAPAEETGTPRAGLIQLTRGARLAPWTTPNAIWAIRRELGIERQLREIVLPLYKRFKKPETTAFGLYKRNFLPAVAAKPDSHVIARAGSTERLTPQAKVTLGDVYAENPAFRDGKDHFTWADVRKKVEAVERRALGGQWVTVSGAVVPPPADVPAAEAASGPPQRLPAVPGHRPLRRVSAAVAAKAQAVLGAGHPIGYSETTGGNLYRVEWHKHGPTEPVPDRLKDWHHGVTVYEPVARGSGGPALAASIAVLVASINAAWPQRARASDGTFGDAEHRSRKSDHNDGNAVDITRSPGTGPELSVLADALLQDRRTAYVILDSRVANPDIEGGKWRPYTGRNPHTRHVHLSIRAEDRDNQAPWVIPNRTEPARAPRAPQEAWLMGEIDNLAWVPLRLGPYELQVTADAIATGGVRLCPSFRDVIRISAGREIMPPTRAIVDARWAKARETGGILYVTPPAVGAAPWQRVPDGTVAQCRAYNQRIGPIRTTLFDGPWKEWVLDELRGPGSATNYGWRRPGGGVYQSLGHRHDWTHSDYSQRTTLVRRQATKNGQLIDMLDELASSNELSRGVAPWALAALRGSAA